MKKSNLAIMGTLAAALAFGFALAGCEHGPGPQAPTPDNPTAGNMTSETATAVFGRYGEGWANYGDGVEIKGFRSASALAEYLGVAPLLSVSYSLSVSASVAPLLDVTPSGATLNISSISGRPVVRIGEGAFKPKEGDKDTFINTVVTVIKLPETLRELGKNVFSGVDAEVKIPEAAIEKIVENAKAGTVDQAEADDSSILQELIGKTVTITKIEDDKSEEIVVAAAEPPMGIPGAIILEAASPADLNTKITQAKSAYSEGDEIVINLTTEFYTAATNFIVIDPGTTDNDVPYTIRGLGTGTNAPSLSAAVLLANDNVTLEYVKIAVQTDNNAIPSSWSVGNYRSALFIGRASSGESTQLLTGADAASNNVTVRNCAITATGLTNFTAGVYIWAERKTDAPAAIYPSTNITIANNTITATGSGGSAVQGLAIQNWHPSIHITNNTITARYGTFRTTLPYEDAPASAIFVNRVYGEGKTGSNADPVITGNTLTGDTYSFFANARSDDIPASGYDVPAGIASFVARKFANADTTWATADSDNTTYRKLFDALKANVTGRGFAYVATLINISGAINSGYFVEQYEIANRELVAISVLGGIISENAYTYNTSGTVNRFVADGTETPKGYDYGRKPVNAANNQGAWRNASVNKFCHGPGSSGGAYQYDTDLTRSGGGDSKASSPSGSGG